MQTKEDNNAGYALVNNRRAFYRDRSRLMMLTFMFSFLANVLLATACVLFVFFPPPAQFIVAYPDGRLIQVQPLSEAVRSNPQIVAFASNAVATVNSFDFVNFQTQLQNAAQYFTFSGWASFKQQLEASGNLDYVSNNRLVSTATPAQVPQIVEQAEINGRYTWKVRVPIIIAYSGPNVERNVSQVVTMLIQRAPFSEVPNGVGIVQYVAR